MPTPEQRAPAVLGADQIQSFREHGHVRLDAAFPRDLAMALQDEIWQELEEEFAIVRDDARTWRPLPHSTRCAKHSRRNEELAGTPFEMAVSDLLGRDDWRRPATWGGFNVFFPTTDVGGWDVPTDTWHWDGPPSGEGLLIFSFYGVVRPRGGGTLIVDGSHRLVQTYYDSLSPEDLARRHKLHRKSFSRWDPWLEDLTGQSEHPSADRRAAFMDRSTDVRGHTSRVIELCGEPGDAVFCNPGMVHCVAPNASDRPRFMRVKFFLLDCPG